MELFHVMNRGVDKRKIFLDDQDHLRFIHDLFEFNDQARVNNGLFLFKTNGQEVGRYIARKPRKLLVDIHAFCLMPNHYHLLVSPRAEGAVSLFMKKVNIGHAKYFNQKYDRVGALFQGRYKAVPVMKQAHFIHLPYYIHCNALDLITSEWRERKMRNMGRALDFLKKYRWSSYLDYVGIKNFPSVTSREFLLDVFGGHRKFEKSVAEWIGDFDQASVGDVALESTSEV